jgi:hypothetical protein
MGNRSSVEKRAPAPTPSPAAVTRPPYKNVGFDHRGWFCTVDGSRYGYYESVEQAADAHDVLSLHKFVTGPDLNYGKDVTLQTTLDCIQTDPDEEDVRTTQKTKSLPSPRMPMEYVGVCKAPDGTWMAVARHNKRTKIEVGLRNPVEAAVEHDRVAIRLFLEDGARNFPVDKNDDNVVISWPPPRNERVASCSQTGTPRASEGTEKESDGTPRASDGTESREQQQGVQDAQDGA